MAEGVAAFPTPILQVGNPALPTWVSLRADMCVKRKPTTTTTTARNVAIATCKVALLNHDNLKVHITPSFGGGHQVLPLWPPLWLPLWQTVQDVMPVGGGAVPVMTLASSAPTGLAPYAIGPYGFGIYGHGPYGRLYRHLNPSQHWHPAVGRCVSAVVGNRGGQLVEP